MALPVNRPIDEFVISGRMADVAATTPVAWLVSPCKGKIRRAYTVVEGSTNGAPVLSFAIDGATALTDTLTIASGGGAGDVDVVTFSQAESSLGILTEGSKISVTSDGAGSSTTVANIFIVCERT